MHRALCASWLSTIRPRKMRHTIPLTIMLFSFVGQSYACKCGGPWTVTESFKTTGFIMSGTVLRTQVVSFSTTITADKVDDVRGRLKSDEQKLRYFDMPYIIKVDFVVREKFKGQLRDTVTIYTAMNSASCGYKFEKDKSYIIYASKRSDMDFMFLANEDRNKGLEKEHTYWTNHCTRTTDYNNLEADELRALKKELR